MEADRVAGTPRHRQAGGAGADSAARRRPLPFAPARSVATRLVDLFDWVIPPSVWCVVNDKVDVVPSLQRTRVSAIAIFVGVIV